MQQAAGSGDGDGSAGPGAVSILSRFQYDFEGRRIKKIGTEGLRQYVYDQTSLLAEYDSAGSLRAKYDYGSDRLISLTRTDEGRRYFSLDGLRSVVNLTDDAGAAVASYHLDPWGNFRFPSELDSSRNRFAFTGHIYDDETGLYNAKARYFDPKLGRFLTQDSYLGQIDEPPSLHRYLYAENQPTVYVDPTGHWVESVWDAASLAMGAVSLYHNVKQGNWGMAALDTVGVVADAVALALPVIPGGAGAAIRASRAAKVGIDALQTADQAINVGQGAAQAIDEYQQGNYGWSSFYAGMSAMGVRGLGAKGSELSKDIRNLSEAERAGVKLESHSRELAAPAPTQRTPDTAQPLGNAVEPAPQAAGRVAPAPASSLPAAGAAAPSQGTSGTKPRGIKWVEEPRTAGPRAEAYQSGAPGARSNVGSRRAEVPALQFDNPNPRGLDEVRFDGLDEANNALVDRKLSITGRRKQSRDLARMNEALKQNPGQAARIEVPTEAAKRAAEARLRKLGINIPVVVAPEQ